MRRWIRAPRDVKCGYCQPPRELPRGTPILVYEIATIKKQMIRCAVCHGPAPDLPALEEPVHTAGDFTQVGQAAPRREWMPYRED